MHDKVFNWAFIGAGAIARSVANRITKSGRHSIAAVYNRTHSRARTFAEKFGGSVYNSVEDAINAKDVNGVYINVTNNAHYEMCRRALECGKPILMEKPFTTSAEQAKELFDLAAKRNVYLCEAMWTWFSEQANGIKAAVENGEIGKITGGHIAFCLPIAFGKNNRLLKSELAGGALLDVGVYPITYAYRLFGKPRDIQCTAKFKFGVDMRDDIVFKYDGFDIIIKTSVRSIVGGGATGEKLVIIGEKGKIVASAFHSGGRVKIVSEIGRRIFPDKNLMLTQFDSVASEIRSGKTQSEFVSPEHSVAVMELLDEIRSKTGLKFTFENVVNLDGNGYIAADES